MFRQKALRGAFLLSLTLAAANATTIGYSGDDPFRSFSIWFSAQYQAGDQLLPAQGGGTSPGTQTLDVNITAGIANLLVDGLAMDAVCVDFFTLIANGNYDVNILGPNALSNGTRLAWMMRNTLPTINAQTNLLVRQQLGAGFQLAVWDIVHDGGDGFALGRIRFGSSSNPTDFFVQAFANQFLSSSAGQSQAEGFVFSNVSGPTVSQLLLSDIPEPGTLIMLGSALVGLGLLRRRS